MIFFTLQTIPKTGINVVSVLMHSHLAAKKLKLRHIRGGKELPPLAEVSFFNRYSIQSCKNLIFNLVVKGVFLVKIELRI